MIDSHCHLDFPDFDSDRAAIIARCSAIGIQRILVPGTELQTIPRLLALAASVNAAADPTHLKLDLALGLHPYFLAATAVDKSLEAWQEWVLQHRPQLRAIGEIGLDRAVTDKISLATQSIYFTEQVRCANQLQLPLVIHHRRTHSELIHIIKRERFGYGGVVHSFTGSQHVAAQYCDLGFKLGVGGAITYPRASKTRAAVSEIGMQHLLLETDAPDMPICGHQGQRNSPQYLPLIAAALAALKDLTTAQVIACTDHNYMHTFHSQTPA